MTKFYHVLSLLLLAVCPASSQLYDEYKIWELFFGDEAYASSPKYKIDHPTELGWLEIQSVYSSLLLRLKVRTHNRNSSFYWRSPPPFKIESVVHKTDDPAVVFILLSNGSVYRADTVSGGDFDSTRWSRPKKVGEGLDGLTGSPGEAEIIGDALYIKDGPRVYVSRDTAQTWTLDTVGLSGYVNDLTVDSNNFVWAATDNGVFIQHPDSNVWNKNPTFPVTNCRSILVDRRGRIFVGAYNMYRSTDGGVIWDNLSSPSVSPTTSLSDDPLGNIYAVGFYGGYRALDGSPPWVNITDTIAASVTPSTGSFIQTAGVVRSITGDTTLTAATIYGLFTSTDQGSTWVFESPENQLPVSRFFGLARPETEFLVSGTLGIYRFSTGDTVPEKVFPSEGFQGSITLAADSSGNVYAIVPVPVGTFSTTAENYKSTDNGTTWFRDSAGLGQFNISFRNNPYFVDRGGTQYVSNSQMLWIKRPGDPWRLDTIGLNFSGSERVTDVSTNNRKGIVYALKRISSTNYQLYQRQLVDSVWSQIDVSSFGGTALNLSSDQNGDILVYARSGEISRYDGSTWTPIPKPPGIPDPSHADIVSVDNRGVIWSTFRRSTDFESRGLFFTEDAGATWVYAGLDSVDIGHLIPDGDTTYAVTDGYGIFRFTTMGPGTSVDGQSPSHPRFYSLGQNYPNPFNPTTEITYSLPTATEVVVKVFDVLGREVTTLVRERKEAGVHRVELNADGLPSGIYFYRMVAQDYTETRKMVLMK